MAKKVLLCLVAFFLGVNVMLAQRVITGQVKDGNGEPLIGVQITEVGTSNSVTSKVDGTYSIKVKGNKSSLLFRCLGMKNEKVLVVGNKQDVTMHADEKELQEVVVVSTGYQKVSRERSTASYGFVDSTSLNRVIHKDLVSALEGQVAGMRMDVNPNTGESNPIIRGVGTFSSAVGTQPLIVIDDIPTTLTLDEINPHDVESVTVLKDAAATSIYGALAANGVVVVTTKQGKTSKTKISINADWHISQKPSFDAMHYASSSDIIDYETEVYNSRLKNSGSISNLFSQYGNNYYSPVYQLYRDQAEGKLTAEQVNAQLNEMRGNDFYDEYRKYVWRNQLSQRYNVSLSQRSGKSNHYASFSYDNNRGRIKNDQSNAFALYMKSQYNVSKWLNIKVGLDARFTVSDSPNSAYSSYTMQERYARIKDQDGNLFFTPNVNVSGYVGSSVNHNVIDRAEGVEGLMPYTFNVLQSIDESITNSKNLHVRPFVNAEVKFADFLKYNLLYQYEWTYRHSEQYDEADTYLMRLTHNAFINQSEKCILPEGGRYMQSSNSSQRYTLRNQLGFDKAWDDNRHSVTAIAGLEFRQNYTPRMVQQLMYGYNDKALTSSRLDWQSLYTDGWESIVYDQTMRYSGLATTQTLTRHRYASFYANAGYNYLGRYNLNGSIRWDETDLFGLDTKEQHHPLWSVGAGWNMSQEPFMQGIEWLNFLKFRATYGINGNVDQSSSTYFVARYRTLSQDPTASPYLYYTDDNLPNPQLRWERTATFNVGFDFRVLGILSGSIEYYNRTGSDLLVRKYLDSTLGATQRVINNGKMRNQGVEISLNGNIIRTRDWEFTANITMGFNSNKMLLVEHSPSDIASNFITAPSNYLIQGTSFNTLWAYRLSRVVNGYPVILDADGNEMATFDADGNPTSVTVTSTLKGVDALKNCGSTLPKYNGSLQLHLRWKNLEANAMFICSGGNKLRLDVADMNSYSLTTDLINDRWTATDGEGKVRLFNDIPTDLQQYASTFSEWWRYSDAQIRNADYVKLRNISIAYSLPDQLTKKIGLGTTRFSLQVNNLFYISAAGHDIDPEAYGLNSGSRSLQQPRSFSLGVSTSF